MTVQAGAEFTIGLRATPTAGYVWRFDALPDSIKSLGEAVEQPAGPPRVGGTATQVFRLQASKRGHFTLRFILKRDWEDQVVEVHDVDLTVD